MCTRLQWENSKVSCVTLSIPYENTLLMQDTQYPTCNLVIPQFYQMITKLEMKIITYVHTPRKETITIQTTLEKSVSPDMTKRILKVRTQMVTGRSCINISIRSCRSLIDLSCISVRFSTQGSRTTTCDQHVSTSQYTLMHNVYVVLQR